MAFGDAVKKILEKIGDFFDIFDLSFFISGALLFAALGFWVTLQDVADDTPSRRMALVLATDDAKRDVDEADKALDDITGEWKVEADGARATRLDALRRDRAQDLRERREILSARQRELTVFDAQRPAVVRFADKTTAPLAILGIYILGLLCFAAGRFLWSRRRLDEELATAIRRHDLEATPALSGYVGRKAWTELYTWLWAWLRESTFAESYKLLRRYWIMTAVYDGVTVALIVWAVLAYMSTPPDQLVQAVVAVVALVVLAVLCKREASRYYRYQILELVATYAYTCDAAAAAAASGDAAAAAGAATVGGEVGAELFGSGTDAAWEGDGGEDGGGDGGDYDGGGDDGDDGDGGGDGGGDGFGHPPP